MTKKLRGPKKLRGLPPNETPNETALNGIGLKARNCARNRVEIPVAVKQNEAVFEWQGFCGVSRRSMTAARDKLGGGSKNELPAAAVCRYPFQP